MYLPQVRYQYMFYDSNEISNVYKFKPQAWLIFAPNWFWRHICQYVALYQYLFCVGFIIKKRKKKSYLAPKYYILW